MPQEIVSQFDRKYGLPIETNRSVQNISQRNAIPEAVRWEGMIVHVIGDQSYILLDGIDNTEWEPLGGLVNVNVIDNLLSTSPTDALSANQGRVLKDLIDNIDLSDYQLVSEKGVANGYAPLDSGAKVPIANLPDSVIGQVEYQGTWAASTNTPTLANPPSSSTKGHYYVCSDNGTQFSISFQTGDWIISNGSAWQKVDNTDAVTSVFGRLGNVVANSGDYASYYLGISAKAADSELLDGLNSTQFLRSDQNDSTSGDLSMRDGFFTRDSIAVVEIVGLVSVGGVVGTDTDHDLLLRRNNIEKIRLTSLGATISGDLSATNLSGTNTGDQTLSGLGGVPTSRTLTAGLHLSGGGDLSANRSFVLTPETNTWVVDNQSNQRMYFGNSSSVFATILKASTTGQRFEFRDSSNSPHASIDADSGNITANSFNTTNWEIVETSGVLQFKYGGVTKFEMNSTGILEGTDFKQGL